ncbi:MAG: hypothetical protein ACD_16C00144G0005 [uncultured bacterium]|nr:MAG: hypothetical protein ACD_16C00144G0005 [uncultured bacterium]HBG34406.1 hypothetical protein [Holosporales bacterium]HBW24173.1 hypothetical protein [Holosporales bacterium]HCC24866.1 hypothetical protein [Holosporales bacterium]HCE96191.1 hypothetical protein [Holosporales bacterium]
MSTRIAKQISARLRAKNISFYELEKKAGLKPHAVQNILRGKSKKPSGELLQSIAHELGCHVEDLLQGQETRYAEELPHSKKVLLNQPYEHPDLFLETVKFVNHALKEKENNLTIEQFISCVEEIYLHSLQKDPKKVDKNFAEWWVDLATD